MFFCLCSVCGRVFFLWVSVGRFLLFVVAVIGRCFCRVLFRRWFRSWRMGFTVLFFWIGGKCSRLSILFGVGLRGE